MCYILLELLESTEQKFRLHNIVKLSTSAMRECHCKETDNITFHNNEHTKQVEI